MSADKFEAELEKKLTDFISKTCPYEDAPGTALVSGTFEVGARWARSHTLKTGVVLELVEALKEILKQDGNPPEFVVEDCHEIANRAIEKYKKEIE